MDQSSLAGHPALFCSTVVGISGRIYLGNTNDGCHRWCRFRTGPDNSRTIGRERHQQFPGRRGNCRCRKRYHIFAPDSDPVSVYHYSGRHGLPGANLISDGSCDANCRAFRSIRHPDAFQFRVRRTIHYGNTRYSGPKRPDSNDSRRAVYDLFSKASNLCFVDSGFCPQSICGLVEPAGTGTFWTLSARYFGWAWYCHAT